MEGPGHTIVFSNASVFISKKTKQNILIDIYYT